MALLELDHLHTFFTTKRGIVKAVNDVSYSVEPGKTLGVVGESGSGKSVSAMSILQLLDGNGYIESGSILFDGKDMARLSKSEIEKILGKDYEVIDGNCPFVIYLGGDENATCEYISKKMEITSK